MRRQVTPDELQNLYMSIGCCVWHLQYVEDVLIHLITLKGEIRTPGRVGLKEAQELLAKHRRNTLGTSLKIIREKSLVRPELLDRLATFKEERDWIIHRSQQTHGDALYTDSGRSEVFSRLKQFEDEANWLRKAVAEEINEFMRVHGVDLAAAERLAAKNVGRMRGER